MKIILLGYMASGKSTIGNYLSTDLSLPFIDLDTYIEKKENKSISKIFEEFGEIYFRKKENKYLKELLNSDINFVLSLGGGTPCYANNIDLIIDSNAASIYLNTSLKIIIERLKKAKEKRPLVASIADENLPEFIAKHLFERRPYYLKANYKILTDNKKIEEVISEIKSLLR